MKTLFIILIAIFVLFLFFRTKSSFTKYRAASNALLAKYTFSQLSSEDQNKVVAQAKDILSSGGGRADFLEDRFQRLDSKSRFGVYALAMAELHIPPEIDGYDWQLIRRPLIILDNANKEIEAFQLELERKHGIKIEL